MDHVVPVGESLLKFPQVYVDIVEQEVPEIVVRRHEICGMPNGVVGYALLQALDLLPGDAQAHVTQGENHAGARTRDLEEDPEEQGQKVRRLVAREGED